MYIPYLLSDQNQIFTVDSQSVHVQIGAHWSYHLGFSFSCWSRTYICTIWGLLRFLLSGTKFYQTQYTSTGY